MARISMKQHRSVVRQLKTTMEANEAHKARVQEIEAALLQTKEQLEAANRDLAATQSEARALDQKITRLYDQPTPTSIRRVVRTIIFEGDPVWVAQTLAQSLPDGRTAIGLLPGGGVRDAITVRTEEDRTTRQEDLRYPEQKGIVPGYRNNLGQRGHERARTAGYVEDARHQARNS